VAGTWDHGAEPTTVLAVASADPKHGRWILPLIITAMIVLTFTFVNSLEPAETEAGTTTTTAPTTTTTTTTLPPDVAAFLVTLDAFEVRARSFLSGVTDVNDSWEARAITIPQTEAGFLDVQTDVITWEDDVGETADVPPAFAENHVNLVLAVGDLAPKIDDIITGLNAPDDGTLRRLAVTEFGDEIQDVLDAIEVLRTQASQVSSGDEADGGDGTDGGEEPTETTADEEPTGTDA
jgi:hypothetical protein